MRPPTFAPLFAAAALATLIVFQMDTLYRVIAGLIVMVATGQMLRNSAPAARTPGTTASLDALLASIADTFVVACSLVSVRDNTYPSVVSDRALLESLARANTEGFEAFADRIRQEAQGL